MTRVRNGVVTKQRHKKILKEARGYFGSKHREFKSAKEQLMHAGQYAYRDRRQKKREFRKLWIVRINAACRENEISYSRFIEGLNYAGVEINRKMASEIAINDPKAFTEMVKVAKEALDAKKAGKEYKVKEVKVEKPAKKEEPKKEEKKENIDEKKTNLPKELYPKDEWDDEEFTWEENVVKPGFKRPCIVHRAILGSVERFAAILIEHFAGKWPFWINPKQISICTVNDEVNDYTDKVYTQLKLKGYQVEWDKSPATLQKKIRNSQLAQFNYIFVIGKDEVKDQCVDVRTREGERIGKYSMYKIFELFKTLEPKISDEEKELKEKIYKSEKNDLIVDAENKLTYNLYLTGDEVSKEDEDLYKQLENENILREEFPNLYKWKLLMKKNLPSS